MRVGCEAVAFAFVLVFVLLHVVFGLIVPWHGAWGFDVLSFCRVWQIAVFVVLATCSLGLAHGGAMSRAEAAWAWVGRHLASLPVRLNPLKTHLVIFAVSVGVLFALGTRYSGGDARWMSGSLPLFLKRSPLASAVLVLGTRLGEAMGLAYLPSFQATATVVGALSVCGLYQAFLVLFGDKARAGIFVAASVASYGVSRLLPGYIEVYVVFLLFLTVFECAFVRYCLTGRGLAWVLGALFVLLLTHVQALVVMPGVLAVSAVTCWRKRRVGHFLGLWAGFVVLVVVVYPLLRHRGESYQLLGEVARLAEGGAVASRFWSTQAGGHLIAPLNVLLSAGHWASVANVHVLVSSIGIALLLCGVAAWWRDGGADRLVVASVLNYAFFAVGSVLYYNFFQPVVRDWDMFGAGAVYLLVLAASVWRVAPAAKLRRVFLIVFGVTGLVTLLWLGQQAGRWGIAPPPADRVSFAAPG